MNQSALQLAVAMVRPGRWGIGVSGGADSVALLRLLALRADLSLHIIHLDHQTRGDDSTDDAEFVRQLAATLKLPARIALRGAVESTLATVPTNPSARYRAARLTFFRRVVAEENLDGVILAHHADDQAETVLQRLIRGSGPAGLVGMSSQTTIGGLTILRPLLCSRREDLRRYLKEIGQPWREDASNDSDDYLRNRLRRWLGDAPQLHDALISLADACRGLRDWAAGAAPQLEETFAIDRLGDLPDVLAHESARQWLAERGAPLGELTETVLDRLMEMARDAGTPARADFPGSLRIRRRGGMVSME
jgi:tRNA(Ile)-lysidine synthase